MTTTTPKKAFKAKKHRVSSRVSASVAALALVAVGTGGAAFGAAVAAAASKPILIGASLSLSGDFSADGVAFERGYELWAAYTNSHGGLLGRKVVLKILSDRSDPDQAVTNYETLISSDHVDLVFGPFSTLLTIPTSKVASRFGYAFVEGAGGAPAVFQNGLTNVFDVSTPVADYMVPFARWVAALPANERPKTAAYPTSNDPFTEPVIETAKGLLQRAGVKTVYSKVFPAEVTDYTPIADQVASTNAQLVVLGSVDVPTVSAFMQAFEQQHYDPKAFIAAAGPDQGAAFIKAVGAKNADGVMVPDGWYPGVPNPQSRAMVRAYIAKYGGSASGVNADVAEAYSVGQVVAEAVQATGTLDNAKLIAYLHGAHTFQTVQGPVKFNKLGENVSALQYIFQWQANGTKFVQVLPANAAGSVKILYPKPAWGG
jgi:branched-chain amino acid transport system substrate-binding protein